MAVAGEVVEILLPVALERTYTYRVPHGLTLEPGDVVRVPLGGRQTPGVVWDEPAGLPASSNRLRLVEERLDLPALRQDMRRFVDWVANWTLMPRGMVMRMALRAPDLPESRPRTAYVLAGDPPARMTPARQRVVKTLEAAGASMERRTLLDEANVSPSVVDALVDAGTLALITLDAPPVRLPDPGFAVPDLSPEQAEAATRLRGAVMMRKFSTTLLEGVTGAGKTEVYFEAVAEAVRAGGQTLILLPEIALTGQFLDRFAQRFGVRPAEWHSGIGHKRRAAVWHGVVDGSVKVVAGARSALFLPFPDLRLLVVDEEHEAAYKQEDGVRYHARDMAVVRGRLVDAAVVLASATPSIESRVNAERGRYAHVVLPARFGGRPLPQVEAVDLRADPPPRGRFLSPRLEAEIRATIERGEQSLVFLNRRGYAPLTLCRHCGHRFGCPNCTAWLVEHRFRRSLLCHHCGHQAPVPHTCPTCLKPDMLAACGPGVERIAEEVAVLFPDAPAVVLSSDMQGGAERLRAELAAVAAGGPKLVIGTQLVAKGHNFPELTLVGVVDADLGLGTSDPRAAERTFQLVHQVTGRAGRGDRPGRALIQTYDPGHPVMQALVSGDSEAFYRREIDARAGAGLPPFGRLAALTVSDNDRHTAEDHARALARAAPDDPVFRLLGPAEAPLAVLRGRHRFRLFVHGAREAPLQDYVRGWLAAGPKPKGQTFVEVDIDPISFL